MSRCCLNCVALFFLFALATVPTYAAGAMNEQFGEPTAGLALQLKPLPKDDLAPFSFEVIARNAGTGSLILAGAKEPQNWGFEFQLVGEEGLRIEGCVVHRTFSTPGPVDMRLQPRQTDVLQIRYDMGYCTLDNRRVPLAAMPAGKYRVRALYPADPDALINGKENPYRSQAISNTVEIELKAPEDRTPRRNGFGLPSNNLSARITPTLASKGEIHFEIQLAREYTHATAATLREHALTGWKFRFFQSNGDVILVHAKKPVEGQDLHITPQEPAVLRVKCDDTWIFERNGFEVPVTRLDPGKYRVIAELTVATSRDRNNVKPNDNTWTGTLHSNVARIDIPPSK